MSYAESMQNTLRHVRWQDYRGSKEGVVINFECSRSSVFPIRDVLNEGEKGFQTDPNIETGTYGYAHCVDARTRNSFVKNRKGYLFFLTNYQGAAEEYRGKDYIVGYYKITQTADVRKLHMRNMDEEMCPELNFCHALRAGELRFAPVFDAFELSSEQLKKWGYKGRLSRQLRLALNEEKVNEVLEYFAGKTDASAAYIEEIAKAAEKVDAIREKQLEEAEEEKEVETAETEVEAEQNPSAVQEPVQQESESAEEGQ